MKFLITGRTAAGKSYFGKTLKNRGFIVTEKKTKDETTKESDILYENENYFYDKTETEKADAILTTPNDCIKIAEAMSGTPFFILYIVADDEARKARFIKKFEKETNPAELFDKINKEEKETFDKFEDYIKSFADEKGEDDNNILAICIGNNDVDNKNNIEQLCEKLKSTNIVYKSLLEIVNMMVSEGYIDTTADGMLTVKSQDTDKWSEITPELFAGRAFVSPSDFITLIQMWLRAANELCPSVVDAIYVYSNIIKKENDDDEKTENK